MRRHWHFDTPAVADQPLSVAVKFARHAPDTVEKSDVAHEQLHVQGATLHWRRHGDRWWSIGDPDCGVAWQRLDGLVLIHTWSNDHAREAWPQETALQVALCEALRCRGLVPLHAAVATRAGDAIAFVGASGSGKSSALLSAMQEGWHPVAEDFAWLQPATGIVYGWDRVIRLAPELVTQLSPLCAFDCWQPDGSGKLLLDYSHVQPSRQPAARLTRVALLHRDTQIPSAWRPLTRHDCVRVLYEAAGVPVEPENRAAFAASVPGLLSRLQMDELVSGCTPLPLSAAG